MISSMSEIGRFLIVLGVMIAIVGAALIVVGKVPWLGRLPGDIHYQNERVTFYFPLATCVLISIVLSLLFYLLRR